MLIDADYNSGPYEQYSRVTEGRYHSGHLYEVPDAIYERFEVARKEYFAALDAVDAAMERK